MEMLLADTVIDGRFQILEVLAAGGQSIGYKGVDLRAPKTRPWDRYVFLKQYSDLEPTAEQAQTLLGHFRSLVGKLSEKANYVVLPRYVGTAGNAIIAVYPFIEGRSLEDELKADCEWRRRVRLAVAITKIVRELHSKGIAHLDLKPRNIIVSSKDGEVYIHLVDLDAAVIDGVALRASLLGTPGYMSPEHDSSAGFGLPSFPADVFTLGIMLCEILIGRHPLYREEGEDPFADCDLHRDVVRVVRRCLANDPEGRPKVGFVLTILNRHWDAELKASEWHDRWTPRGSHPYVRIWAEEGEPFERTYYDSKILDRNELRGSGGTFDSGPILRLDFDPRGCNLIALRRDFILLGGTVLAIDSPVRIAGRRRLCVGGVNLVIEAGRYGGE